MNLNYNNCWKTTSSEESSAGFTLFELLVVIFLVALMFGGLLRQYRTGIIVARDHNVRIATQVQAQAILQTIGSELRILGNGVPFDQANFQIGESSLTDPTVTEPIVVSTATSSYIQFRLNETGQVCLVTQDFDPSVSLTVSLTDVSTLAVNDPIYMSNSVVAGDDGLYGTIASIDTSNKTITLNTGYDASPDAVFAMGSILEEVPVITYQSLDFGAGIMRDSTAGAVLLGANSTLSITYLDSDGNSMTLPLTQSNLINDLRSFNVSVTVTSANNLSTGEPYTVTVSQIIGIRNFNYYF